MYSIVPIKEVWIKNEGVSSHDVSMITSVVESAIANPTCIEGETQDALLSPVAYTSNSNVFKRTFTSKAVVLKLRRVTIAENGADPSFFRELEIWIPLQHRNILPLLGVYACFQDLKVPALVSEYQRNGTLPNYLHARPEVDRIQLLAGVAQGLLYLHNLKAPIIHGDIRGANIVVGVNGEPMIFDFGCSCTELEAREIEEYSGTTRWMAPEKIDPGRSSAAVTQKADIYSFGCLCIEVFTGEKPFSWIPLDCTVMCKVITGKGSPIQCRPRGQQAVQLTDTLWEAMQSCWKFNPSDRPTIGEICSVLARATIGSSNTL